MVNTDRINELIKYKGLKKQNLAEQMGISRQSLAMKLSGKHDFKVDEVKVLINELNISDASVIVGLFFMPEGSKNVEREVM